MGRRRRTRAPDEDDNGVVVFVRFRVIRVDDEVLLVERDGGRPRKRLLALRATERLDVNVLDLVVVVGRLLLFDPSEAGATAAGRPSERQDLAVLLPDPRLLLLLFLRIILAVPEVAALLLGFALFFAGRVLGRELLLAGVALGRLVLFGLLALAAIVVVVRSRTRARAGIVAVGLGDSLAFAFRLSRRGVRCVRRGLRAGRVGRVVFILGGAADDVNLEEDRMRLCVGAADCAVEKAVGALFE